MLTTTKSKEAPDDKARRFVLRERALATVEESASPEARDSGHPAALGGRLEHLDAVAAKFKTKESWTTAELREIIGDVRQAEVGLRMFGRLGFADRRGPGIYRLNKAGSEYLAEGDRTKQVAMLRASLLRLPDFRLYWDALPLNQVDFAPRDVANILEHQFQFHPFMARNYTTTLIHWGFRTGLLIRATGRGGRYRTVNPSDPVAPARAAVLSDSSSLPAIMRELDQLRIRLGMFLADDELLSNHTTRAQFIRDFSSLPSELIQNGNRELLELLKLQAVIALEIRDVRQVKHLYRMLDHLSKRLLKEPPKG
jgi:hypothetical protein